MEVTVNGEKQDLPQGMTAAQLLQRLNILAQRVVVERNLVILKRAQLAETVLESGDTVEIVHFVGGG